MNRSLARSGRTMAAVAAAALMGLMAYSCGGSEDTKAGAAKGADTTAPASNARQATGFAATTNIRYIDLDSILAHYTLAQEINAQGNEAMLQFQQVQRQKESELQTLGNNIQQKLNNNGYLSEESYKADVNSFNNKQAQAQNYLNGEQQKIAAAMQVRDRQLQDSINNFLIDYNATRHYDAILYRNSGVYFNPSLDITPEVIQGLNERYKADK